jgi:hypothetical protein
VVGGLKEALMVEEVLIVSTTTTNAMPKTTAI